MKRESDVRVGSCRHALTLGLVLSLGWLPVAAIQAQGQLYQGRTLPDWAGLLEDADPSTRLRAVDALRLGFGLRPWAIHILSGPRAGTLSPLQSTIRKASKARSLVSATGRERRHGMPVWTGATSRMDHSTGSIVALADLRAPSALRSAGDGVGNFLPVPVLGAACAVPGGIGTRLPLGLRLAELIDQIAGHALRAGAERSRRRRNGLAHRFIGPGWNGQRRARR